MAVQYAERLPIGTEQIIKHVPAGVVQAFYRRWYRPEHMAVVAVGDFEDVQVRHTARHHDTASSGGAGC